MLACYSLDFCLFVLLMHTHTYAQLCFDDASVTRTSLEDFRPVSDAAISALRQRDVVLQIGKSLALPIDSAAVVRTLCMLQW
jgi:hypothetical protein